MLHGDVDPQDERQGTRRLHSGSTRAHSRAHAAAWQAALMRLHRAPGHREQGPEERRDRQAHADPEDHRLRPRGRTGRGLPVAVQPHRDLGTGGHRRGYRELGRPLHPVAAGPGHRNQPRPHRRRIGCARRCRRRGHGVGEQHRAHRCRARDVSAGERHVECAAAHDDGGEHREQCERHQHPCGDVFETVGRPLRERRIGPVQATGRLPQPPPMRTRALPGHDGVVATACAAVTCSGAARPAGSWAGQLARSVPPREPSSEVTTARHARTSARANDARSVEEHVVVAVDLDDLGPGQRPGQAHLAARRHDPVVPGDQHGGGHVDAADPAVRAEVADRLHGRERGDQRHAPHAGEHGPAHARVQRVAEQARRRPGPRSAGRPAGSSRRHRRRTASSSPSAAPGRSPRRCGPSRRARARRSARGCRRQNACAIMPPIE